MCSGDHFEDSYTDGAVYQVTIMFRNGMILRSTPMSGIDASEFTKSFPMEAASIGFRELAYAEARALLEADAIEWEKNAVSTAELLVPHHVGFARSVEFAHSNATILLARAISL
ncbi:MAG: hypothetical protein JWN90_411 [Parcubacteria group bacterium]|nr:hypothetical protein [Parcubacteria group bacterium]